MDYLNYTFKSTMSINEDGMDCFPNQKNKSNPITQPDCTPLQFINYPYGINYSYNFRGFRDSEWPKDLSDVIWCLGDSFTLGLGAPFEHTWPSILQSQTKMRCINLGIDGAANRLILNIAKQVISNYNPKYIAIMWSYRNRRYEDPWKFIHYDPLTTSHDDDKEFFDCFNSVNTLLPNIYHTTIPFTYPTYPSKTIFTYEQIDTARDGFHFDYLTAETIVDSIIQHFNFKRYDNEV
jgi:hypothetical protein